MATDKAFDANLKNCLLVLTTDYIAFANLLLLLDVCMCKGYYDEITNDRDNT